MPKGVYERTENHKNNVRNQWKNPVIRNKMINGMIGIDPEIKTKRMEIICHTKSTDKYRIEQAKRTKEQWSDPEILAKISGKNNYNFGKKKPELIERNKRTVGPSHPNWLGGRSFEPYGLSFNNTLKEQIRKRDNYQCQECLIYQSDLDYKLPVHHIDFNKKNNGPLNLISLCKSCHSQTGFDREDWAIYYKNILENGNAFV